MKFGFLFILFTTFLVAGGIFLYLSRPDSAPLVKRNDPEVIRVCEANIYYANKNFDSLTEQLLATESDVFIINEWTGENLDLNRFLHSGYNAAVDQPHEGVHGIAVIARKELKASGEIVESPVQGPCRIPFATVRLQFDSVELSLLGIHAPPPLTGCQDTTDPTIREIGQWVKDGRLHEPVGMGVAGQPVILAGDFNAFSFNPEIRRLLGAGLEDSYSAGSSSYGPTWAPFNWMPALIRIDYIFIPQEFSVDGSYTMSLPGSDHRAVISDIRLKNQ